MAAVAVLHPGGPHRDVNIRPRAYHHESGSVCGRLRGEIAEDHHRVGVMSGADWRRRTKTQSEEERQGRRGGGTTLSENGCNTARWISVLFFALRGHYLNFKI